MRILSVYYMHKRGGFCLRLYRLLNALAARGNSVTYLSLDPPPAASLVGVDWKRIPFPLARRSGFVFWGAFTIWLPFYLLVATYRIRPDRLIAFGAYYAAAAWISRVCIGVPVVLFLRALTFRNDQALGKSWAIIAVSNVWEKVGVRFSDRLVVLTQAMKQEVVATFGVSERRIEILPNDVPQPTKGRDETRKRDSVEPIRVISAGVIDVRKNVRFLIDAVDSANRALGRTGLVLTVVGDGAERVKLVSYVEERGIGGVIFAGWKDSIREDLGKSDLMVHAALHEGMPNVVLEAWAESLPVFVADTGELSELVNHDKELLFSLTEVQSLAGKLVEFVTLSQKRSEVEGRSRAAGRRLVFDWDSSASDTVTRSFGDPSPEPAP